MNLLESVTRTCQRLAPGGWHSLLLAHGLDILAPSLKAELLKPLIIDRTLTGFEDFCPDGNRAIEPALPAQSLLYHALASPQVTADETGQPLGIFPTHAEIEAVLNYVFGIQPPTLNDLLQQAQGAPSTRSTASMPICVSPAPGSPEQAPQAPAMTNDCGVSCPSSTMMSTGFG